MIDTSGIEQSGGAADTGGLRALLRRFFESLAWEKFIITVIIINAISLGLETSTEIAASHGAWLALVDKAVVIIFIIEIALRIFAFGGRFWRDPWSLFDFSVVSIALMPATGDLSILRGVCAYCGCFACYQWFPACGASSLACCRLCRAWDQSWCC